MKVSQKIIEASQYLQSVIPGIPDTFVILGSGFKYVIDDLEIETRIALQDIPHWPVPSVVGHGAELVIAKIGKNRFGFVTGRVHMYEGYSAQQVVFGVATLAHLGCRNIIFTNAAGSLRSKFKPGNVALIKDHINMTGRNCLIVDKDDVFTQPGEIERFSVDRFLDMTGSYSPAITKKLKTKLKINTVVYAGLMGPNFETGADCHMLKTLGADVVGMSTVQEVMAAHYLGLNTLGLSFVTNVAGPKTSKAKISGHDEVIDIAKRKQKYVVGILKKVLEVSWS